LTLSHEGDIADRQPRLQPINQVAPCVALAILMMMITDICGAREKLKKYDLVSEICLLADNNK
tara:strand:+ start:369 stop:557 length:189 start_codon:yes stop_codon:yes gene_type:complete